MRNFGFEASERLYLFDLPERICLPHAFGLEDGGNIAQMQGIGHGYEPNSIRTETA